jgi:hypothetical protein
MADDTEYLRTTKATTIEEVIYQVQWLLVGEKEDIELIVAGLRDIQESHMKGCAALQALRELGIEV